MTPSLRKVPLVLASLLSALIESLSTPWGLFRHYWALVKLLLTIFATIVLLAKMPLIGYAARPTAEATLSRADLYAVGIQLAVPCHWRPASPARGNRAVGAQTMGLDALWAN